MSATAQWNPTTPRTISGAGGDGSALAQAQAQLEEQRATERYALGGVGVEVENAFRDAEVAARRLSSLAEGALLLAEAENLDDLEALLAEVPPSPGREPMRRRFRPT